MIHIPYVLWRGRYSPLVPVSIIKENKKIRTLAYLDTGATYSIFNNDYAERLGIELESGDRFDITVGDGGMIPIYLHSVVLIIEDIELETKIGFSSRLGTGINILGRDYVMDEFIICFDGFKKEVIWKLPAENE